MVQLYETMLTRHTVMIVGPTGGGKSVVINTLAQAQTRSDITSKMSQEELNGANFSFVALSSEELLIRMYYLLPFECVCIYSKGHYCSGFLTLISPHSKVLCD